MQERISRAAIREREKEKEKERKEFYQKQRESAKAARAKIREKVNEELVVDDMDDGRRQSEEEKQWRKYFILSR